MSEDEFWDIIEENTQYIHSKNYEGPHEHLLRLCFQLLSLSHEEYNQFLAILYERFYTLFSVKHINKYALLFIAQNLYIDEKGQSILTFPQNSKEEFYSCGFISNYRDFRYDLIRHGRENYQKFLKDPNQIINITSIGYESLANSIFRIEKYVYQYRYYNFDHYNFGTFSDNLKSSFEKQRMREKIEFGNYVEDTASILPFLKDYTPNQSLFEALENFEEDEQKIIMYYKDLKPI